MKPAYSTGISHYKAIFRTILAVAVLAYLLLGTGKYIWEDEAYTFAMIKHNYSEICTITAADVHPPLYYILLKFCIQPFGYSLTAAKIFSIIPYMLIMALGGIELKKIFNEKTALTFMMLFLFFPYLLSFAVEIRMYSLGALFVFASGIYAYKYYESTRRIDFWIWVIAGTAACYTHYFALVSTGIIYFIMLIAISAKKRRLLKQWFAAVFVTFLLYLPWIGCFVGQLVYKVNNEYWIAPITKQTLVSYVMEMFAANMLNGFWKLAVLLYFSVFVYILLSRDKKVITVSVCALLVPLMTVIVGVVVSRLVRPIFVLRYIIPSLPFLLISMAVGMGRIQKKVFSTIIWLIILTGGVSHYAANLHTENIVVNNAIGAAFVQEYSDCDSYIVFMTSQQLAYILTFYETEKPVYINAEITAASPYTNVFHISEFDADANKNVIMMVDADNKIPDELTNEYKISYIKGVNASNSIASAYRLTH